MAFTGPLAMILLFISWLVLLIIGFGFITWWFSDLDFGTSMAISGSSVFTLGIVTGRAPGAEAVEIVAAGVGLMVVALEIAYLPALYNAFAARETEATLLATRAGLAGASNLARRLTLEHRRVTTALCRLGALGGIGLRESHQLSR